MPKGSARFLVVGEEKGQPAYYSGWWHTYRQPLFTHHPALAAKLMSRANANRVRRRLENPEIWGGKWRVVSLSDACAESYYHV